MLGIVGAMKEEVGLIIENTLIEEKKTVAGRTYHIGKFAGKDVVIAISGIGKVAAAQAVTTLIQTFSCGKIIFAGTAGAADPELNVGDIVVGDSFIQHDFNLTPLGMPDFQIPGFDSAKFTVQDDDVGAAVKAVGKYLDEKVFMDIDIKSEIAKNAGMVKPTVVTGVIASGDKFMADSNEVKKLFNMVGGLRCLEMESAAAAQVCTDNCVPLTVIRVISDKADEHADFQFEIFVKEIAGKMLLGCVGNLIDLL